MNFLLWNTCQNKKHQHLVICIIAREIRIVIITYSVQLKLNILQLFLNNELS